MRWLLPGYKRLSQVTEGFYYPPVHVSGAGEHQRCRRKWLFSDRHWGFGYRPIPTNSPAAVGTLFHDTLSLRYGAGLDWMVAFTGAVKMWVEHAEKIGTFDLIDEEWWSETQALARSMVLGYAEHYDQHAGHFGDSNLEFLETERKFSLRVGDYQVEGIWDGIVLHKPTGMLWVFETKTTNNIPRMTDGIQWDYQPKVYVAAAEQIYGRRIGGVIYNIVKRADPYSVKMLKNGLPSTAKAERESVSPSLYRNLLMACIDELGVDPDPILDKYNPLIAEMEAQPNPLYVRHPITFSSNDINRVLRYVELEANAMVGTKSLGLGVQPSYNRYTCGGCAYRWACQALDGDADWRGLLDATMRVNTEDVYGDEAISPDDD